MTRLARILPAAVFVALTLAPAAYARTGSPRTLAIRVPVPEAGDFSVASFELSVGGEGKHHRQQVVRLSLRNRHETGVFAFAHVHEDPHHPGRALGVLEVFHRASGKAAAARAPARAAQFGPIAHASAPLDEFLVQAVNERLIKETIKQNIIKAAADRKLGADGFCEPENKGEYILGNEIIDAAYVQAGGATGLPSGTSGHQLANDAAEELCDEVEDFDEFESSDDEEEFPGIAALLSYLGAHSGSAPTAPTAPTYPLGFSGMWSLVEPAEVKLTGSFTWSPVNPARDMAEAVTSIKVVLPSSGSTPRYVSNWICPMQLPTAAVATSTNPNDTLTCSGGTLPINQQFTLNVQSYPPPSTGMGGTIFAQQNGSYLAPFTFGGP